MLYTVVFLSPLAVLALWAVWEHWQRRQADKRTDEMIRRGMRSAYRRGWV